MFTNTVDDLYGPLTHDQYRDVFGGWVNEHDIESVVSQTGLAIEVVRAYYAAKDME